MVARVNQARLNPKDIPAAKDYLHGVVVPGHKQQPGFRNVMMLAREDGHVLVVELYDSPEQLRETETTGWYQRMAELFEDILQGQVRRTFYEVTLGVPIDETE
jgi:quinol monooxygenase YgiN